MTDRTWRDAKTDTETVKALASAAEARHLYWSLGSRGPEWIQTHAKTLRALASERDRLQAENRDLQLQMIANDGQAQEAYETQVALKAENERLRDALEVAEPALRHSSSVIQNLENVISDYRQDWAQADTAADIALAALEATK